MTALETNVSQVLADGVVDQMPFRLSVEHLGQEYTYKLGARREITGGTQENVLKAMERPCGWGCPVEYIFAASVWAMARLAEASTGGAFWECGGQALVEDNADGDEVVKRLTALRPWINPGHCG